MLVRGVKCGFQPPPRSVTPRVSTTGVASRYTPGGTYTTSPCPAASMAAWKNGELSVFVVSPSATAP